VTPTPYLTKNNISLFYQSNYSVNVLCRANDILALMCLFDGVAFYQSMLRSIRVRGPFPMTLDTADVLGRVSSKIVPFYECDDTRSQSWA